MSSILQLETLSVRLVADASNFNIALQKAEKQVMYSATRLSSLSSKLGQAAILPFTVLMGIAVQQLLKFDQAMTRTMTIMGDLGDGLKKHLEGSIFAISSNSTSAPTDLANAYGILARAGLGTKESMAALVEIERYSVATVSDLNKAVSELVDIQTALGLRSNDTAMNLSNLANITDILAKGSTIANTTAEQLAEGLGGKTAAAIRNLRMPLEEAVAALAVFASQGVKGKEAGTYLETMLKKLQTSVAKNSQGWDALGISAIDTMGNMKPLADIMGLLEQRFKGTTAQTRRMELGMLGFDDKSLKSINMLIGMSDMLTTFTGDLNSAGGSVDAMAKQQLASFSAQLKILWNNLQIVLITVAQQFVPAILFLNNAIRSAIDWWMNLDSGIKHALYVIGASVAIFTFLGIAVKAATVIFALFISPLMFVIATLGTLVGVVVGVIRVISILGSVSLLTFTVSTVGAMTKLIGMFRILASVTFLPLSLTLLPLTVTIRMATLALTYMIGVIKGVQLIMGASVGVGIFTRLFYAVLMVFDPVLRLISVFAQLSKIALGPIWLLGTAFYELGKVVVQVSIMMYQSFMYTLTYMQRTTAFVVGNIISLFIWMGGLIPGIFTGMITAVVLIFKGLVFAVAGVFIAMAAVIVASFLVVPLTIIGILYGIYNAVHGMIIAISAVITAATAVWSTITALPGVKVMLSGIVYAFAAAGQAAIAIWSATVAAVIAISNGVVIAANSILFGINFLIANVLSGIVAMFVWVGTGILAAFAAPLTALIVVLKGIMFAVAAVFLVIPATIMGVFAAASLIISGFFIGIYYAAIGVVQSVFFLGRAFTAAGIAIAAAWRVIVSSLSLTRIVFGINFLIANTLSGIVHIIQAAWAGMTALLTSLAPFFQRAMMFITDIIGNVIYAVAQGIKFTVLGLLTGIKNLILGIVPFLLNIIVWFTGLVLVASVVATAVAGVVQIFQSLGGVWDRMKDTIPNLFVGAAEQMNKFGNGAVATWGRIKVATAVYFETFATFMHHVGGFFWNFGENASKVWLFLVDNWREVAYDIGNIAAAMIENIVRNVMTMGEFIIKVGAGAWKFMWGSASAYIEEVFLGLKHNWSNILSDLGILFKTFLSNIMHNFGVIMDALQEIASNKSVGIMDRIQADTRILAISINPLLSDAKKAEMITDLDDFVKTREIKRKDVVISKYTSQIKGPLDGLDTKKLTGFSSLFEELGIRILRANYQTGRLFETFKKGFSENWANATKKFKPLLDGLDLGEGGGFLADMHKFGKELGAGIDNMYGGLPGHIVNLGTSIAGLFGKKEEKGKGKATTRDNVITSIFRSFAAPKKLPEDFTKFMSTEDKEPDEDRLTGSLFKSVRNILGRMKDALTTGDFSSIDNYFTTTTTSHTTNRSTGMPGLPGLPALPGGGIPWLGIPGSPGIPGLPYAPSIPSISMPGLPGLPGLPGGGIPWLGIPGIPGMPGIPSGLPYAPSIPTPSVPRISMSGTPGETSGPDEKFYNMLGGFTSVRCPLGPYLGEIGKYLGSKDMDSLLGTQGKYTKLLKSLNTSMPDDAGRKILEMASRMLNPKADMDIGDIAGRKGPGDTFKQINLERFQLDGLGGLSRGSERQMEVTDKATQKKLDELIRAVNKQDRTVTGK